MALDGGRGRGQHDRELAEAGAGHRHVARLVVHPVLLLEAAVVLLVHHDEAEARERQEQGRAGADHDARLAAGGGAPGARPLRRGERGVPLHRRAAEAALEAVHELAGEGDLGQHDERLRAPLQGARHRLEVDLGLARAGDAVEQRHREAALGGGAQRVRGVRLRVAELDLGVGGVGHGEAPLGDRHLDQHAGLDEAVDHGVEHWASAASAALARTWPSAATLRARWRAGVMRGGSARRIELHPEAGLVRLEHRRRPHHHAHHHAQRRQRVAGHPLGEAQREDGERRHLGQGGGDGLELPVGDRLARIAEGRVPHHAEAGLRAEGDQDEGAGRRRLQVVGQQVVVGLVERHRQQHGHPRAAGRGGDGCHRAVRAGFPKRGPATRSELARIRRI